MSASSLLHERLAFDVANGQVLDGDRRYVLMRADVLMGMFELMPQALREQALQACAASVMKYGIASVRAYQRMANLSGPQLFETVGAGAASLGWGTWTFELQGTSCRLFVRNSPFAAAAQCISGPACAPIAGMLEAVCTQAWGGPSQVREVRCSHCHAHAETVGPDTCLFEASLLT